MDGLNLFFSNKPFFLFYLIRGGKLVTRCPLPLYGPLQNIQGNKNNHLTFPRRIFVFLPKGLELFRISLFLSQNFYSIHNSGLWPNITCKGGANWTSKLHLIINSTFKLLRELASSWTCNKSNHWNGIFWIKFSWYYNPVWKVLLLW